MKRSRMGMALASAGLLGLSTLTAAAPAFADYGKKRVWLFWSDVAAAFASAARSSD